MSDSIHDEQAPKKDEERKKGGVSFSLEQLESLQNTLAQAGSGAGSAGAGATAAAGALGSKIAMVVVVSMLGAGAFNMSRLNAPPKPLIAAPSKAKFADKTKYEGDLSKLPSSEKSVEHIQDVVIGNMDGKTAEQRAADAAAADAQAKAEADQQAKDQAAAKAAQDAQAASAVTPAPSAPAAPTTNSSHGAPSIPKPNSPFSSKFGALSGAPAGAGGTGASGGGAHPGAGAGLAHPAASGLSKGFGPNGASAKSGGSRAIGGGKGGNAFSQLTTVNGFSRSGAASGTGEGGASNADRGFSNNGGIGGSPIAGGGGGVSGQGVHTGAATSKGSQSGPIGSGAGQGDGTQAAAAASHTNATSWQGFVDIGKIAMIIGVAMLAAAFLLSKKAEAIAAANALDGGAAAAPWFLAAQICAGIAIAAGAVAAICGIAIMGQGQMVAGALFTAGGAAIGVLAYLQLTSATDQSAEASSKLWAGADTPGPAAGSTLTPGGGLPSFGGGAPETMMA
jgi:hypothetical protein